MTFKIEASAPGAADLWLYGDIGGEYTAKDLADQLKIVAPSVRTLTVHINSPGGDVFDGLAMYNVLRQHPARVVTEIDGAALSIASVIALAGDEVRMAGNALFMIHNPWCMAMGDARELRETALRLDKVRGSILGTYLAKTQQPQHILSDMMDAETWFTAEEAQAAGFVDSVTEPLQMAASASLDLSRYHYKKSPPAALAMPEVDALRARLARMEMIITKRQMGKI